MTRKEKLAVAAGFIALTGLLIYAFRRVKGQRMLREVSDEGYETAQDVLFPKRRKAAKTHYGPVLPS